MRPCDSFNSRYVLAFRASPAPRLRGRRAPLLAGIGLAQHVIREEQTQPKQGEVPDVREPRQEPENDLRILESLPALPQRQGGGELRQAPAGQSVRRPGRSPSALACPARS